MTIQRYDLYIDGQFSKPAGGEYFESFDPYAGKPWAQIAKGGDEDVKRAV